MPRPDPFPMAALKDFFTTQLRLKRDARGLRIVLQSAPVSAPAGQAPPDPARVMRGELTALLDRAAGSRRVVRHLAAIEHALARRDATGQFISELSAAHLKSALREFDMLVGGGGSSGLDALRGRLVAALAVQEAATASDDHGRRRQQPVSSFLNEAKLEVNDARHSDFDKASAAWLQPAPGGKPAPKV